MLRQKRRVKNDLPRSKKFFDDRPCKIGIKSMSLGALDQNTAIFSPVYFEYAVCAFVALQNACKREIGIMDTADDDKRSVCDQASQISHFKIFSNGGNIVAAAMMKGNDGILKFTNRTGRHGELDAVIHASGVKSRSASSGISHAQDPFHIYTVGKISSDHVE